MNEIIVHSFAKINLSIDVLGTMPNGMHQVDMIMQQISFHDDVNVRFKPERERRRGDIDIIMKTNRPYLPVDDRNLGVKAARLVVAQYGEKLPGGVLMIDILKRIPVAAGLAGGSGNGAAVIHGLNTLWRLGMDLEKVCELCGELGSDVPFSAMGQARCCYNLPKKIRKDSLAVSCARAGGSGTSLTPLKPLRKAIVIAKPPISVSTREVYGGIDDCVISRRPDNEALAAGLAGGNDKQIYDNFVNVLEEYSLRAHPEISTLKEMMEKETAARKVMMSGSGPTVFGVFDSMDDARAGCEAVRKSGYEAYWTKTTR